MTEDKMDLGMETLEVDLEKSDIFGCKKAPKEKESASLGGIKLRKVW